MADRIGVLYLQSGLHAVAAPIDVTSATTGASELRLIGGGGGVDRTEVTIPDGVDPSRCWLRVGGAGAPRVTLERLVLHGAVCVEEGGSLVLIDCRLEGVSGRRSGGALYVMGATARVHAHGTTFASNSARDGGAAYISGGVAAFYNCTFVSNRAAQRGGALFLTRGAALTLGDRTLLTANTAVAADGGASLFVENGTAGYVLPAPLGRWVPAQDRCGGGASSDAVVAATAWLYDAIETDFPLPCAPGLVGADYNASSQNGAQCSGACPEGHFCGSATAVPVPCDAGYYCPEGSPAETPCPRGTYGNARYAASQSACIMCPAGTSCSLGSTAAVPCGPGSVSAAMGSSECSLCDAPGLPPGSYQAVAGQTACDVCPAGYYSANILSCEPCAIGDFCVQGVQTGSTCGASQTTLRMGAASADSCVCKVGRFMNYINASFAAGGELTYASSSCDDCPSIGFECTEAGNALETLRLTPGYWRSHPLSAVHARLSRTKLLGPAPVSCSSCMRLVRLP